MVKPSKLPTLIFSILASVYAVERFQPQTRLHFPRARTSLSYLPGIHAEDFHPISHIPPPYITA